MNFIIEKKAKKFLEEKDINSFYITTNVTTRACCGPAQVEFNIYDKKREGKFQYEIIDGIKIFYEGSMKFYFEDEPVYISASGIGPFKNLYVKNEVNTLK
ncbi:MAG: hypothetical protein Q4B52_05605 [Tissierellia bacterium]|nr:hypothetical protein [Tissierellia bacterium]